MKIVAIMQARMGSSRLPGKVLEDVCGKPMLARAVERVALAKTLNDVIVATTVEDKDDSIAAYCQERGWSAFRGSEWDVLDRYYQAAKKYEADIIVRVTSDCPLLDPEFIDEIVTNFLNNQPLDYYCSFLPHRSYPRGLDVEVFSFDALERSWKEDSDELFREHVTMYMLRNPEIFKLGGMTGQQDYSHLRWTVDLPEDLELVQKIYEAFNEQPFGWKDVISLFEKQPELIKINQHVEQFVIK